MSFIDALKAETDNNNHCMEDVIIREYIEGLKWQLKSNFYTYTGMKDKIYGYAVVDRETSLFHFVETEGHSIPRCNRGIIENSSAMKRLAEKNNCRIKENYDYDYIQVELRNKLYELGLKNCSVEIHILPRIIFKQVEVRKFLRKKFETIETVDKSMKYCYIFIECEI